MPPWTALLRSASRALALVLCLLMLWDGWEALDRVLLQGPPADRVGALRLVGAGLLLGAALLGLGGLALRRRALLAAAALVTLAGSAAVLLADGLWRVESGSSTRVLPEPQEAFGMLVLLPLPFLLASRTYAPRAAVSLRERAAAWRGRLDALAEEP